MIKSIKNLEILTQSVTIDITGLSQYDNAKGDIARITSNIKLVNPLPEETQFVLPDCEEAGEVKFYLPDGTKAQQQDFDPAITQDVDQLPIAMRESLEKFISNWTFDELTEHVKEMENYMEMKSSKNTITIPAGQNYFTFTFSKYIGKNENGEFTLETCVPFNGFTINPNASGTKANVIVLMPYEFGENTEKVIDATWIAPNSQVQQLDRKVESGRVMLSKYWTGDPAVSIKYKY